MLYLGLSLAKYGGGWGSRAIGYALIAVALVNVYLVGVISFVSYACLAFLLACRVFRAGSARASMLLGFAASGLVGGGLAVLYYPAEAGIHFNAPGVLLGDELYSWAVNTIGDPSSPNADETVPAILRLPWVYVTGSLALWTAVGIPFTAAARKVLSTLASCTTIE